MNKNIRLNSCRIALKVLTKSKEENINDANTVCSESNRINDHKWSVIDFRDN